jgi:hypothetical protein
VFKERYTHVKKFQVRCVLSRWCWRIYGCKLISANKDQGRVFLEGFGLAGIKNHLDPYLLAKMTKNIPTLILKFLRFALEISNLTLAMTH